MKLLRTLLICISLAAVSLHANAAQYLLDTFTTSSTTLLTSHTSDSGASWLYWAGSTPAPSVYAVHGDVCASGTTTSQIYRDSVIGNTADTSVSFSLYQDTSNASYAGAGARLDSAGNNGYLALYNQTLQHWEIYRVNTGLSLTLLASSSTYALTNGSTYSVQFTVVGSGSSVALNILVAGTSVVTYSDTSGSRVTAAGYAGVFFETGNGAATGLFLNSIEGDDYINAIAWTQQNQTIAMAGAVGNPATGTISWTQANNTMQAYQNSVTVSWGAGAVGSPDNGSDEVGSESPSETGTPRTSLNVAGSAPFPTTTITDNSGNSPYITVAQQGFGFTTGTINGGAGFAQPWANAVPSTFIGSLTGTTLVVASVTFGNLAVGQQLSVAGSTLAGPVTITNNPNSGGPGTYTVTNPSSVTEGASTTFGASTGGGLTHAGRYYQANANTSTPNEAGLFSDATQATGFSQPVIIARLDGSAFNFTSIDIAPIPTYANNGTIYVTAQCYTGTPVTINFATLVTTGATLAATQTLVNANGAAYQRTPIYGFNACTSVVLSDGGYSNNNIVGGVASNAPYYSYDFIGLVPLAPLGGIVWSQQNDTMSAMGNTSNSSAAFNAFFFGF